MRALFMRDVRLSVRAGGGALIGVLFFLAVVAVIPFGYLSAGQQRRIAMARLLVSHRPLWILDEPTSALDVRSQEMFAGLVADHLGDGGLAVVATHHALGLTNTRSLVLQPGAEASLDAGDPFAVEASV